VTVSVIVCTYNRGQAIGPTLASALAQTKLPEEVVLVDDGSTDGTSDWVRDHFRSVRVVKKTNGGTSSARNFGAAIAEGDVLVFLDHDDELMPHGIGTLTGLLDLHPTAAAAFADHTYTNSVTGDHYPNHHSALPAFARLSEVPTLAAATAARLYGRPMFYALLRGNLLQQPWAVRRDALQELGGYDESIRLCEDWDLYIRLAKSFRLALSNEVISRHCVHGDNLHLAPGQAEMHVKVLRKVLATSGRFDFRARRIVRRKLAGYFKAWGDGAGQSREARRWYLRSALMWPGDMVVLARVLWPTLRRAHAGREQA
jgi:glycosyltransferase involved in cell wall biosynthesis